MFRFERHLMKVDPETCSVHYILYLRFYKISLFKMLDLFPIVKGFCFLCFFRKWKIRIRILFV